MIMMMGLSPALGLRITNPGTVVAWVGFNRVGGSGRFVWESARERERAGYSILLYPWHHRVLDYRAAATQPLAMRIALLFSAAAVCINFTYTRGTMKHACMKRS